MARSAARFVLVSLLAAAPASAAEPEPARQTVLKAAHLLDVKAGRYLEGLALRIEGDPLADVAALRKISFVMKGGRVVRRD